MKILIFLLTFVSFCFAQQVNYTWGVKTPSGDAWGAGLTYIDTTVGTTNNIIVDLKDYFLGFDISPAVTTDSANTSYLLTSERFYLGTFYCAFDNQGVAPTADSLNYTIKVYPGVYNSDALAIASIHWGAAVTLETINVINDYLSVNNIYVHATKYKHFPPEVFKLEIAPIGYTGCDDSTAVDWRVAYPQVYQQEAYRVDSED
jgi:hypothetical protein